jgi:membrane dipeptidase
MPYSITKDNIALFDGHCDTLSNPGKLVRARVAYKPYAQVFAIWGDAKATYENTFEPQMEKLNQANLAGVEAYVSVEGAHILNCSVGRLRMAAQAGMSMLALTWNNSNPLCGSCAEDRERGLSNLGKAFVSECEKFDILLDVSHLSDAGIKDLFDSSTRPFAASHSNCRAVCDNPRNLTNEQIKMIIAREGVIGLNLHKDFVGGDGTVKALVRHALHILEFDGGDRTVAIGSDFDGGITPVEGLDTYDNLVRLFDALVDAGVTEEIARDIFYNNWSRVFRQLG